MQTAKSTTLNGRFLPRMGMPLRSFSIFGQLRMDCPEMTPESSDKLMEENAPEDAARKQPKLDHDSAPEVGNAAAEEQWTAVKKPKMLTGGEWMNVDVTTQPVSEGSAPAVNVYSDRKQTSHQTSEVGCSSSDAALEIADTLQKALRLQWTALDRDFNVLRNTAQQEQVLHELKKTGLGAHWWYKSIQLWKAKAKEVGIKFKDLKDDDNK